MKSRLVLDANVVRYVVLGDIDPAPLFTYVRAGGSVHIADGTIVELIAALHEQRLPWPKWTARRSEIARLVDHKAPIMLGGADLLDACGVKFQRPRTRFPRPLQRFLNRRSFELFMHARSLHDASRLEVRFVEQGRPRVVIIDMTAASKQLETSYSDWIAGFERLDVAAEKQGVALPGRGVPCELLQAQARSLQGFLDANVRSTPPASLRLDAQVRVHSLLHLRRLKTKEPYNARKNRHDALDFDLCRYLAMPAAICTADDRFRTKLRDAGTWQSRWVVTPDELADSDVRRELMHLRWPSAVAA